MARIQLALNVSDLSEAIDFYTKLFGSAPAKVKPGYANFAVADPPLKLVLIEEAGTRGTGVAGALNHLGVEVDDRRRGQRCHPSPEWPRTRDQRAAGNGLLLRCPGQGLGRGP